MNQEQEIIFLTRKLLAYTETALSTYELTKQEGVRGDFHSEVKPFADGVKATAMLWKEAATAWVIENKPKNLHPLQIQTAADYLEVISVQAFFPETSKKRFMDQIQSVEYILNSGIVAIENDANQLNDN
jgi:hypothetical protein